MSDQFGDPRPLTAVIDTAIHGAVQDDFVHVDISRSVRIMITAGRPKRIKPDRMRGGSSVQ